MPFSTIKQSIADKKAGPYNITPQIDEQEVLRINNILKDTTTSEYEGYKKIADGATKATNATDAYIASCIKMDKQASQADYATFAMQTMSQRAYTKQGVKDILRQYDELDAKIADKQKEYERQGGEQALAALEAKGIDLVNGKLEKEIKDLDELERLEAAKAFHKMSKDS